MLTSMLSPSQYHAGDGALAYLGEAAGAIGKSALVIHGAIGLGLVAEAVWGGLAAADVAVTPVRHHGHCGAASVERICAAAARGEHDLVIGVGGGRVMDVTKAVAQELGLPYGLVPTSPATCAATTAVVVYYSIDGAWQGSGLVRRPAQFTIVDPQVLAAAPDRLLVAGLVDALAKVVEVRFAAKRLPELGVAPLAALALCDELERAIVNEAEAAVAAGPGPHPTRMRLAEMSLLWPGLIGALAGERAKLAAAHSVHNALTLLAGVKGYLHGELLAFGILVQYVLEGRDETTLSRTGRLFAAMGCPSSLVALGCEEYLADADARLRVLSRACELPAMRACFPAMDVATLSAAFEAADEVATSTATVPAPA